MSDIKATPLNGCWEKLWSEAANDFWGVMEQQDKIRNILVLAHKVPGEVFPDLQKADIPEVLNICADKLTQGYLGKLIALSGMADEKESDSVGERNQPIEERPPDDSAHHFLEDVLLQRCLKFKHEMQTVVAAYKEV